MEFIKIVPSTFSPKMALAMPDGTIIPACVSFEIVVRPGEAVTVKAEFMLDQESLPISTDTKTAVQRLSEMLDKFKAAGYAK